MVTNFLLINVLNCILYIKNDSNGDNGRFNKFHSNSEKLIQNLVMLFILLIFILSRIKRCLDYFYLILKRITQKKFV